MPDGIYLASTTLRGIEIRSFKNRALSLTLTNVAKGSIQFSPDSQRLLTSGDSGLELWNTRTWQKETELRGATEPFAFARNGKVIVARRDDHLALWNLQDSRKVADLPGTNLFGNLPAPMAVSSDGNRVFLATLGRIRAWDLQTQTELNAILLPGRGKAPTYSLAHSPDGLIASTHLNGEVRLWDSQTGELLETFEDHRTVVFCAVFSPDGSYLATAGGDQTIALYETRSRKLLRRFKGHEGEIEALMFSGDSRWLVSGCRRDQSVRLWEVTGEGQAETPGLRGPWLQFTDSNRSLVGRSPEGYLRIDVKTGASRPLAIGSASEANSSEAPALLSSVSPDGSRAAVVSADRRSLWVWNIGGGAVEAVLLTNSPILIRGAGFSGDGKRIAVGVEGWKTRVWNTADWTSKSLDDSVSTNTLGVWTSLNGSRLVQGDTNGLEVLDFASGKSVLRVPVRGAFYGLALSPDGTLLALGISGGPIQIWNVDQGRKIGSLHGHLTLVRSLSFSPDGKTLASGAGGELKLWDLEVQQEILTWEGLGGVPTTVLFATDGSCLAARVQGDRQLQLWRAPSFEEIAATEAREQTETKQP